MRDNIVEIFFDAAKKYADKTAIVHKQRSISYKELAKNVNATSAYLTKNGIKSGDKIMVFVPMSIQLYTLVLALFSIGAIVVFVDEWSDKERLKKAVQVVDIDVIIAPRKILWLAYILPVFRKIKRKLSIAKRVPTGEFNYISVEKDSTALITFTTGSTGIPKAANRTHQFLWEQFRILKDEINAKENDNCLITLPIVLLSILGTGATGYIADFNQKKPHKLDAEKQVAFAQKNEINILIASPFFIEQLAKVGENKIFSLGRIITGGAPVFPKAAKLIRSSFPTSENIIAYGSTEAEPISSITMNELLDAHPNLNNGLCVGEIHSEIQCKIIKITEDIITLREGEWGKWEVDQDELGEIIVTGPHVLDRYYNSEIAFKENKIKVAETVWHRTGDSGKIIDGRLFLHGRCSQLINRDGKSLSPFIVENQLKEIGAIAIGTLIHHKDKLVICVELEDHISQTQLEDLLKEKEVPFDLVQIFNTIPRDPRHFSKIEYARLRGILSKSI